MPEPAQVETPVDKEKGQPFFEWDLEAARFARRLPYIQKYFPFRTCEREGEDVGCVRFFACPPKLQRRQAICFIHAARKRIPAQDEREFVPRSEDVAREFFKRNTRHSAAYRFSYFHSKIFLFAVHCFLLTTLR